MTVTVITCRLFGGRNLGVTFDSVAGTISILGQSLTLSTLSTALQAEWANAVGTIPSGTNGPIPAFGGSNIGQAVGDILDLTPTWRNAVRTAVNSYANSLMGVGTVPSQQIGDPETWNRM
jgi:hypothetical protein